MYTDRKKVEKILKIIFFVILFYLLEFSLIGILNKIELNKEVRLIKNQYKKKILSEKTLKEINIVKGIEINDILDSNYSKFYGYNSNLKIINVGNLGKNFHVMKIYYRFPVYNFFVLLILFTLLNSFLFLIYIIIKPRIKISDISSVFNGIIIVLGKKLDVIYSNDATIYGNYNRFRSLFPEFPSSLFKKLETMKRGVHKTFEKLVYKGNIYDLDIEREKMGYHLFLKNISTEIALKEEIEKNSEFLTMGKFSSMLAHELRNPLSTIKASSATIKDYETDESKLELLNCIIEETERLSKLVEKMLNFSNPFDINKVNTDIKEFFFDMEDGLINLIGNSIKLELIFKETIIFFEVDTLLLKNVITNICENAAHAIKKGDIKDGSIHITVSMPTEYKLNIEIANNGQYISKKERGRIFEPFFSTDPQGFGLGLAIVKKIIDLHQGKVEVESNKKWTTFKITLEC
jgi:nitrogen-specific signal transduction histidine kinase